MVYSAAMRVISRVREARLARGLSQDVLAQRVGISSQALRSIEAGKAVPGTDVALRLAQALARGVEDLFELSRDVDEVEVHSASVLNAGERLRVASVGGRLVAHSLRGSSGFVRALPRADAVAAGGSSARLLVPPDVIDRRLLMMGCDPAAGLLAEALTESGSRVELVWVECGSRGALEALARRETHVAGCHLFDESSGADNRSAVESLTPFPCTLVTFALWEQGLIVAPGNPKGIVDVSSLPRPDVRFVNREQGSGSRQLLEGQLRKAGIAGGTITGYDDIAHGHLAVAECVAQGRADVGIGIRAAANALGLGFATLAMERYDLVIPNEYLGLPAVQALLDLLGRRSLRREIEALGGYDTTVMGTPQ